MKILLTGGSGFLGWNVVRHLVRRRHDLVVTYHDSLSHYLHQLTNQAVRLDLSDGTSIHRMLARVQPEIIIHAAALAHAQLHTDRTQLTRVNVDATEVFARWSAEHHARLIFISTDLVYPSDAGVCDETTDVATEPANEYVRSKIEAEGRVRKHDPDAVIIRPSLMFGPAPEGRRPFNRFLEEHWSRGEPAPLLTDQVRSFLYVEDMVSAILLLAELTVPPRGTFVCGGGEALTRYEFGLRYAAARGIDSQLCKPLRSDQLEGYRGGPSTIVLDTHRLGALGWRPRSLDEAFELTARSHVANRGG